MENNAEQALSIATSTVGFIGVGNMGEALLVGLLKAGAKPSQISFAVRRAERSVEIVSKYGIKPATLTEMASTCDVLLIIVKPQDLTTVTDLIAPVINPQSLVISFLAGKKTQTIAQLLGGNHSVIRVMPNTPTMLGVGMSGLSAGEHVSDGQIAYSKEFLDACGKVVQIDEELQDALAATSGSGPAYFFAFVEAMIAGAVELGLGEDIATTLTVQTILGAARMLDETGKSASTLRENVTSPKGMTYEGLKVFNECHLGDVVAQAMKAARDRSRELA